MNQTADFHPIGWIIPAAKAIGQADLKAWTKIAFWVRLKKWDERNKMVNYPRTSQSLLP